jgi:hypothetical protein
MLTRRHALLSAFCMVIAMRANAADNSAFAFVSQIYDATKARTQRGIRLIVRTRFDVISNRPSHLG